MFSTVASLLSAATLCVSCNDPAIEPSKSLVGARKLPSAAALSRETLYITRGGSDWGGASLTYELRPDHSLTVTHTYSDGRNHGIAVRGKETLGVSPEVAAQVRQLFWRLRPAQLDGQGLEKGEVRPLGCERQGPHDFGEVTVAFISEGDTTGIEDDRVGAFELPSPDSCNTPAATEARKVAWQALRLLPQSEVTATFEQTS